MTVSPQDIAGIIRLLFGAIFLIKLGFSLDAAELVWAHRRPAGFKLLAAALVSVTAAMMVGLFSGPMALASWLLYVILFRYASLYCLEDVLVQAVSFYLVLAAGGSTFSLDSFLGLSGAWGRFPGPQSALPELCLTAISGAILFSGGYEKAKSRLWQGGLACYYFFLLPNVRRFDTAFITSRRWLSVALNYVTLVFELGYLPALMLGYMPWGAAGWVLATGFTLALIFMFVVDWIGETQLLMLGAAAWLILRTPGGSLLSDWKAELSAPPGMARWVAFALTASLIPPLWALLAPKGSGVFDRALRTFSRFTWGLMPVSAFNERQLKGPVVYEVQEETPEGGRRTAWPIFTSECTPGTARTFRPTFFETMAYKVTDACVEFDAEGRLQPERDRFIRNLASFARRKTAGAKPQKLIFRITQINPPAEYIGSSRWYLSDWRTDAFEADFSAGEDPVLRPLSKPILKYATGRDATKTTFRFAA